MFLSQLSGPGDILGFSLIPFPISSPVWSFLLFYIGDFPSISSIDFPVFMKWHYFSKTIRNNTEMRHRHRRKSIWFSLYLLFYFLKMLDRVSRLSLSECVIWTIYCVRTALASLIKKKMYKVEQSITIYI